MTLVHGRAPKVLALFTPSIGALFDRCELAPGALVLVLTSRPADGLHRIPYVVDSNHVLRRIPYWLVPCNVRFAEDVHLSIEGFTFFDGFDRFAFGVQNGSD